MDAQDRLRGQIRAGRELLNMKQADLAAFLDVSLSKVSRAESGDTKSGDVLLQIKEGLERCGVKFTSHGVELDESRLEVIEGRDCYLRLLDDVYRTLKESDDKEILLMFASDKASPPEVNHRYRFMRQHGVKMRQLIEEGDAYLLGALEEYRTIPSAYFTNIVTVIYADKVAQVNGSETRLTIQHDAPLAEREKKMFSYFWDTGKKPEKSDAPERFEA